MKRKIDAWKPRNRFNLNNAPDATLLRSTVIKLRLLALLYCRYIVSHCKMIRLYIGNQKMLTQFPYQKPIRD